MILLPNKSIIISYNQYVHKSGGFCITISTKNQIKKEEIELTEKEIKSFKLVPFNKNRVVDYYELLEKILLEQNSI